VQFPQWLSSMARLAHEPEHSVVPEGHPDAHANVPPEGLHTGVLPEHVVVHDPQWPTAERSVSQPSLGLDEQCAYPGTHVKVHVPPLQERPAAAT
jgi:hypothetical protein